MSSSNIAYNRSKEISISYKEEISKAIGMHGRWKLRLKQAIAQGNSEFEVEKVRVDGECAFGKWLNSLPQFEKQSDYWKNVKQLHIEFHKEAARVLQLALNGQKQDAEIALSFKSNFSKISADLTNTMVKWKEEI
jgi:hypothetical protein